MSATFTTSVATIGSRDAISFTSNLNNCSILNSAFNRYSPELMFRDLQVEPVDGYPLFAGIEIVLPSGIENQCGEYPHLASEIERDTYERYELNVEQQSSSAVTAKIQAWTVWGALRGLETFSQLVWQNGTSNNFFINISQIVDSPRYPHRGFMIDTARHYVDIPVIETVLEAMAYTKLNVLHWHIVDDQSFPFVSKTFPELSAKGAYLPELTYEPEEVQGVINYARDRGIRVILEFDTPGHTHVYRKSYPELLTPCYGDGVNPGTPNFTTHAAYEILDPTKEFTYSFMEQLFAEIKNVSKDEFIHLGMDECFCLISTACVLTAIFYVYAKVYYSCWQSSPEIKAFMEQNNYTEYSQVQEHYTLRHLDMVKSLGAKALIWHDPLEFGVNLDKDIVLQVWKKEACGDWTSYFQHALDEGYQVILSSPWYLNYIAYGETWKDYYESDPVLSLPYNSKKRLTHINSCNSHFLVVTEDQQKLILGGEACVWAEYADPTNLVQRIFPYIGAIAERLWSPISTLDESRTDDAMHRLDQHRCRLLWRGIPAQPIFNGYCFPQEKSIRKSSKK
ncbi:Beta-hexosaminidase subunit beta, partial [Orchesella cincta]